MKDTEASEYVQAPWVEVFTMGVVSGRLALLLAGGKRGHTQAMQLDLDAPAEGYSCIREALVNLLVRDVPGVRFNGQAQETREGPVAGSSAQPVHIDVNLSLDGLHQREVSKTKMVIERDWQGRLVGATTEGVSDAHVTP